MGGMHFTMMRILILAGLAEASGPKQGHRKLVWDRIQRHRSGHGVVAASFIVITLQWMNPEMLIASLGNMVDALGGYLVLRFFVPDGEAIRRHEGAGRDLRDSRCLHDWRANYGINVFNLDRRRSTLVGLDL